MFSEGLATGTSLSDASEERENVAMEGASAIYARRIEGIRDVEFPMLKATTYLDHAGTTVCSKSMMERFALETVSNLYGNPHSSSPSSQASTMRVDDARLRVLQFCNANPEDFDVVFVANATAGIKLVADAFRDNEAGFSYYYHIDSHTSLVGVREIAHSSRCFVDQDVADWLCGAAQMGCHSMQSTPQLFAYPAQSNFNGHRLPLGWSQDIRASAHKNTYILLDAAAYVSTSPLDLSDASHAPDFVVLSFNKIFGFPNLGALLVRKTSEQVFRHRKYFGGGTVDTILCGEEKWHSVKTGSLHERLEDGSLPILNIVALDIAIDVHLQLFESMEQVSSHTFSLARDLFDRLKSLRHMNGEPVCEVYAENAAFEKGKAAQGAIVSFNIKTSYGMWVSTEEVEKLATIRNIHLRTGGLCNPGGLSTALGLEPWELRRNFAAGVRCGTGSDVVAGKPTGAVRASLGAMSTMKDVKALVAFVRDFYTEANQETAIPQSAAPSCNEFVESITIYPIKSCGGFIVPATMDWAVKPEGLAWDREWCLVHQGTGQALSQKRYPRMALIRPKLDLQGGVMQINFHDPALSTTETITVPLSSSENLYEEDYDTRATTSRVCGDMITARAYKNPEINCSFSRFLGVPSALVRFPAGGEGSRARSSKLAHMLRYEKRRTLELDKSETFKATRIPTPPDSDSELSTNPILLSNESPILVVHRSSVEDLNVKISEAGGKSASASVFRANIIIASSLPASKHVAYSEDSWTGLQIGAHSFGVLGSCRRCHMICVDQETAKKDEEPFVTLARTRASEGKIFFGSHISYRPSLKSLIKSPAIRVGDLVVTSTL